MDAQASGTQASGVATTGDLVRMRVQGMDCAACALKVETALLRLPGVSELQLDPTSGSLALRLDPLRVSLAAVEGRISALGYLPLTQSKAAVRTAAPPTASSGRARWWREPKALQAIGIALLLALAWAMQAWSSPAGHGPGNPLGHVHSLEEAGRWWAPAHRAWWLSAAALLALAPFARRAWAAGRAGMPFSVETLMTVAVLGALVIGEAEEAALVVFLFAIGEWLEALAAQRMRAGIRGLVELMPRTAWRQQAAGGQLEEVPVEALRSGDLVVLRAGDRIPADGLVLEGEAEVDEAPLTGESTPVGKRPGSAVFAGSLNGLGHLRVRVEQVADGTRLAQIAALVEQAQASKAPMARAIERLSRWYTPAAMAAALLVILLPPLLAGGDWLTWVYRGLATLLIACPCALMISTPAAIASGMAAGARRGLLVKSGAALEALARVRTVAFDKTGTLTRGQLRLSDVVGLENGAGAGMEETEIIRLAAAVEQHSSHPVGRAIVEAARARGLLGRAEVAQVVTLPGRAIGARVDGRPVAVGSPRHASEQTALPADLRGRIDSLEAEGKTVVVLLVDGLAAGLLALRDEPRADAAAAVAGLQRMGLRTLMLTGDNRATGQAIAAQLGMPVAAELLPDAKLAEIRRLQAHGPVAMVGDGINDAPALAAASVGVAMGGGTEAALETADAAVLHGRIAGVTALLRLARATLGNIRQNILIALGLKAAFLLMALSGATPLWAAVLADTGATVLVTGNALRLLGHRGDG